MDSKSLITEYDREATREYLLNKIIKDDIGPLVRWAEAEVYEEALTLSSYQSLSTKTKANEKMYEQLKRSITGKTHIYNNDELQAARAMVESFHAADDDDEEDISVVEWFKNHYERFLKTPKNVYPKNTPVKCSLVHKDYGVACKSGVFGSRHICMGNMELQKHLESKGFYIGLVNNSPCYREWMEKAKIDGNKKKSKKKKSTRGRKKSRITIVFK